MSKRHRHLVYPHLGYRHLSFSCATIALSAVMLAGVGSGTVAARAERKLLFFCNTTNGKQIHLYDSGRTIDYYFGKPQVRPEMSLQVPRDRASTWQWQGIGRAITYSVDVPNGDTTYSVFWRLDRLARVRVPEGGVQVAIKGKYVATVNCRGKMINNLEGVQLQPTL